MLIFIFIYLFPPSLWLLTDHRHLGGRQTSVCSEGRDRRKRMDPVGAGRRASSGERTAAPCMNINRSNLDTLIQIKNGSQHSMWNAYISSCVTPVWISRPDLRLLNIFPLNWLATRSIQLCTRNKFLIFWRRLFAVFKNHSKA